MIPGLDREASPAAGLPQVVFHGWTTADAKHNDYGYGNIDRPLNVTGFVDALSWTHSINAPYETMNMTLTFPEGFGQNVIPGALNDNAENANDYGFLLRNPDPGFWAVLYLPNKDKKGKDVWSAVHWGRCSRINGLVDADDNGTVTHVVYLEFESWAMACAKSRFLLTPMSAYIRSPMSIAASTYTCTDMYI